jgi:indole-3-glycerol phosphate synthase
MTILDEICAKKREHVAAKKRAVPLAQLEAEARYASPVRGFEAALRKAQDSTGAALIAEIKKASPSKGLIRADFDPPALARAYEKGGATCLSVLTDEPYFQGADEYLQDARVSVGLPVLRKDFMVDPYQVIESRALDADCILIILAETGETLAGELAAAAKRWEMDALFEIHDETELGMAVELGATLIGINNRDLKTFKTTLAVTERLAPQVPPGALVVSESGINTQADIARLKQAGISAFLVGESLMREADVETATATLLRRQPAEKV